MERLAADAPLPDQQGPYPAAAPVLPPQYQDCVLGQYHVGGCVYCGCTAFVPWTVIFLPPFPDGLCGTIQAFCCWNCGQPRESRWYPLLVPIIVD